MLAWPCALLPVAAEAGSYTIYSSGDSFFDSDKPNDNFGSNTTLDIRTKSGDNERAVLFFDLSSIPAGETVTSAALHVYVSGANSSVTVNVHRITDAWAESTVTWANTNADFDPTADGSYVPNATGLKTATITGLVQEWRGGVSNFGIMLISSGDDTRSSIWSEEATAANRPRLVVVTTAGPPIIVASKAVAVVQDPVGSPSPKAVPGARIRYTISATNSGQISADSVVVSDVIPANTVYVGGSMTLNGGALTDAGDADAGVFEQTPAKVRIAAGALPALTGSLTITFDVVVN